MRSNLFTHPDDLTSNTNFNALETFCEKFPGEEFWRFFIERDRYAYYLELYQYIYAVLYKNPPTDIEEAKNKLQGMMLGELIKILESRNEDTNAIGLLQHLKYLLHWTEKNPNLLIIDLIEKQKAWIGFEDCETNYLLKVTEGFSFILKSIIDNKELNVNFIKDIHRICTSGVKNMVNSTPGEFRKEASMCNIVPKLVTKEGLMELFAYCKWLEGKTGIGGVAIVQQLGPNHWKWLIEKYQAIDFDKTANYLIDLLQKDASLFYRNNEGDPFGPDKDDVYNINEFLTNINSALIIKMNQALASAKNKEEKLKAIFTYLKSAIRHHPFSDGVGRTFCMILLQYLLLKENLLPMLIKNPHVMLGHSVNEMINQYLDCEREMIKIMDNYSFIESKTFYDPNISTSTVLSGINASERNYFKECLDIYKDAILYCKDNDYKKSSAPKKTM